jgi:thioredoxin-related protein
MERSKASFLLPALVAGALVLIFSSALRPVAAAGDLGRRVPAGSDATGSLVGGSGAARVESISWMTIEEAAGKLKEVKKPLIIDLYTTWCGWCKQMDKKTYSNKQVAQYLQEKFYTVKIDAETHATINWSGKVYNFNPQYRSNEFALYLTHGRLEFPTTIIIVPGEEPQAIPGYMEPKELESLVKYFGEGAYRTKSFDDFQKNFRASW